MSTNSGSAPACEIASVVAMKVCGTVTTTSPGSNTGSHQGKAQRVGAAADGDRVLGVAEGGKRLLEILDHGTADEAGGPQSLLENFGQFLLQFNVRRNEIKKRNAGIAHFVTSEV